MLTPMYFQPLSPQQANPFGYGLMQGAQAATALQDARQRAAQAALLNAQVPYAAQQAQAALQGKLLANQLAGINVQYAPQQNQSEIALRAAQANAQNALPGLYGAEAGEASARAGLTRQQAALLAQQAPYMIAATQGGMFKDPILQRSFELGLAQRTGAIPQNILSNAGVVPTQASQAPINAAQQALPGLGGNINPLNAPKAFTGDTASNFLMFGTPYNPIQFNAMQKGAETAAKTGVTQFNDLQNQANDSAQLANQTLSLLKQFQDNYDKSTYKGARLGAVPSSGFGAAFVPGDLSAEQATDNASQNIAATVAKMVAGGRVTNYEMQYINQLKPNRNMTPQTANMAADFLSAKMNRLKEQQSFLNAARSQNVDPQTANTLWQMYETQRPVYDFSQNKTNKSFQGSWRDFLNPQAITAAQSGQTYVNVPQFSNKADFQSWYKTQPADVQNAIKAQVGGR